MPPFLRKTRLGSLLKEFQHCLLGLVGLRHRGHAGLLQNVVLRHVSDRGPDIRVLNAILSAGKVGDLGVFYTFGCCQLVY